MKPILLVVGVLALIMSLARYIQITNMIWNEVLTPAKVFHLSWLPTLGIFVGVILIGYTTRKK